MTMPPWTYSRLSEFENCGFRFYHTKVVKTYVDGDTAATIWGTKVHTALENAMLHGTPLPDGMTQWQSLANKFIALPGEKLVEYKFAVDANFEPHDWKDSWSRGIADLVVRHKDTVLICDWKTGKKKPSEQLELYAAYAKALWPETKEVQTAFVWLQPKQMTRKRYDIDAAAPVIWQDFVPRARRLERAYETDTWVKRPSGLCKNYCPVLECAHNGRR